MKNHWLIELAKTANGRPWDIKKEQTFPVESLSSVGAVVFQMEDGTWEVNDRDGIFMGKGGTKEEAVLEAEEAYKAHQEESPHSGDSGSDSALAVEVGGRSGELDGHEHEASLKKTADLDLLDAAKEAVEIFSVYEEDHGVSATLEKLEKAIAKEEGREYGHTGVSVELIENHSGVVAKNGLTFSKDAAEMLGLTKKAEGGLGSWEEMAAAQNSTTEDTAADAIDERLLNLISIDLEKVYGKHADSDEMREHIHEIAQSVVKTHGMPPYETFYGEESHTGDIPVSDDNVGAGDKTVESEPEEPLTGGESASVGEPES